MEPRAAALPGRRTLSAPRADSSTVDAVARRLGEAYGLRVTDLAPVRGGESAQAYRATAADGRPWFVKVAAPDPCDPRDAAETERALRMTAALRPAVRAAEVVAPGDRPP